MTTLYLAARHSRFLEMQDYALTLELLGYTITSRWILGDHDLRAQGASEAPSWQPRWAMENWDDLCAADICLSFTEPPGEISGRGLGERHVEQGIALALGKCCIVVGFRENGYHWLPQVKFYRTWEECLSALVGVEQ